MFNQGVASGIVFGCFLIFMIVIVKVVRGKRVMEEYDERQILARSRAYQAGFFTLMACMGVDVCIKLFGAAFYEEPLGELFGLFIALIVFGYNVIKDDAFIGRGTNKKNLYIIYIAVIFAQLANTISGITEHQFWMDGKLTIRLISPLCALTFSLILLFQYLHDRSVKTEDEEE